MRTITSIAGILLIVLSLSACDMIPESVTLPFADTGPDPCDSGGTLFSDDFSGEQDCGWVEYNRGGAVVSAEDGAMHLSTSSPGEIWWTNPERTFEDVIITATASQLSGTDDNAYGLICRYKDEHHFYLFVVSGDGYYAIGKYAGEDNPVAYLTPDGQYQSSDIINKGIASNDIQASCIGNELSLAVNGQPLMTAVDGQYKTGDIGLAASALQQGTVEISFDDVKVYAP